MQPFGIALENLPVANADPAAEISKAAERLSKRGMPVLIP